MVEQYVHSTKKVGLNFYSEKKNVPLQVIGTCLKIMIVSDSQQMVLDGLGKNIVSQPA